MSNKSTEPDALTCIGGCIVVLVILAMCLAISAGFGWLTMAVLAAFGIHLSFWICWGIWALLSTLFKVGSK
jgi:hypothetical protein